MLKRFRRGTRAIYLLVRASRGFGGEQREDSWRVGGLRCERCGGWPHWMAAVSRQADRGRHHPDAWIAGGSGIFACRHGGPQPGQAMASSIFAASGLQYRPAHTSVLRSHHGW